MSAVANPTPTTAELQAGLQRIKEDIFRDQPAELGFHIYRKPDGSVRDIVAVTADERRRINEDALLELDEPFDDEEEEH